MSRTLPSILLAITIASCAVHPRAIEDGGGRVDGSKIRIADPYAGGRGEWYRGQVHMHSTTHKYFVNADSLKDKVTRYRDAGYDFVCGTDHNFIDKLDRPDRLPLPTEDPGVPGIHFISGVEVGFQLDRATYGSGRKHHIGGVGMDWSVSRGDSLFRLAETDQSFPQAAVDSIRTMYYAPGKPALVIMNHPEMRARGDVRFYPQDIAALRGTTGIEVYNAKWARARPGSKSWQSHGASHWDYVIQRHDGPRWGFATDDAHEYVFGEDYLSGWILVQAEELSTESLLDAVRAGRFVACVDSCTGAVRDTTSAVFTDLGARDGRIVAASDRDSEFSWWTDAGHLVRRTEHVRSDAYEVEGWERSVRVRVRNAAGAVYSQPFLVENEDRDEDRWQLRRESDTRLLVHFNEGSGPVAADASGGGYDVLISPVTVPAISEWKDLADTAAYRDSLWGGWLHNGVGTTPDESDVDRDRAGYALRAYGTSVAAEVPVGNSRDLLPKGEVTLEVVGAFVRRTGEEQPILVHEDAVRDEPVGWRLVLSEASVSDPYRFRHYDEQGNAHTLSFGRGLVPGEAHLVAVTLSEGAGATTVRAYVGGVLAAEHTRPSGAGEGTAWREPGGSAPPLSLFSDPRREEPAAVYYRLRELRLTGKARDAAAIRDDADRLLLTNP